jgi:hypothetical protein
MIIKMKKLFLSLLLIVATIGSTVAQQPSQRLRMQAEKLKAEGKLPAVNALKSAKPQARAALRTVPVVGNITLDLSKSVKPENFTYTPEGYWTETYNDADYTFIECDNFSLSHLIGGDSYAGSYWDGFTVSKNGDNTKQDFFTHQWGNMAGGGIVTDADGNVVTVEGKVQVDKNIPYLIANAADMSWAEQFTASAQVRLNDSYQAVGMYVNAAPYAYYTVQDGDGGNFARALDQDGDYFKLLIHGLNESYEDNGKVVEYYLAKNEGGILTQSADWEYVDLSALGEVYGFYYTMESSDVGAWGMNTPTYFCMDKLQVSKAIPEHNASLTVPEEASVWIGNKNYSAYMYMPLTKVEAVGVSNAGGKSTYYYNVNGTTAKPDYYRVKQEGKITHAGKFPAGDLEITAEQLASESNNYVNHDVTANNGYNVSDIFLNINEKGHLKLASGETHQLIPLRNWTLLDNVITAAGSTTFIEPDYHYTVINENGETDNSVVSIDDKGLLTATGSGTAIVLVSYDALNAGYINTNFGGNLWSALWAENTGVFVVSVDAAESGIVSGITINESLNTDATHKMATTAVDAELDVFYYLEETGGYDYTFTPNGVTSVELAQPTISGNDLSFNGFGTDGVSDNGDGSYTVKLIEGRNIVKLSSASGTEYQVLTAKAVNYTVSNLTNPEEAFSPGDKVSITFNTLYHPCGKLAGVYNMTALVQYTAATTDGKPVRSAANQYKFASTATAQTITAIIPAEWDIENDFIFSDGVLGAGVSGFNFGNPYGDHRNITFENGIQTGFGAAARTAWFGALPEIFIRLAEHPSTPANLKGAAGETTIHLSWDASRDNKAIAGYHIYVNEEHVASVATTSHQLTNLTSGTQHDIKVQAYDHDGNVSEKLLASFTTLGTSTGIDDASASNINIYPNPFADYLVIKTTIAGTATVYNLSGTAVLNINLLSGNNRIETSALPKGIYILKVDKKVIKLVK